MIALLILILLFATQPARTEDQRATSGAGPQSSVAGPLLEDKDLTIMRLQKVIAEQTLQRLLENRTVAEYERVRANYQALLGRIAEKEKTNDKKSAD